MDGYRDHPSEFDAPSAVETAPADDVASAIGTDERRMHVRAYNHWVSLLDGRDFPSIEDLEPGDVEDFARNSVLLDFTCGRDNPAIPYIGSSIRDECGLEDDTRMISQVPARSLLSRLTDHYLQIIANRAPIGFEAEFSNQREESICYRGILMPFSSDGETIDFIYGVINWKSGDGSAQPAAMPAKTFDDEPLELELADAIVPATEPVASLVPEIVDVPKPVEPAPHPVWEDGPLGSPDAPAAAAIDEDCGAALADRLWAARETAEAAKVGEGRSRAALYEALAMAYDFALAAEDDPDDYRELLEDSGVKAQARAPMTPIVKLVFGIDYDKARLTEFAAALSFARRTCVATGGFKPLIESQQGGLKGLVSAERQARRPGKAAADRSEQARSELRSRPATSLESLDCEREFALVLVRRGIDGKLEPIALLDEESLVERAIRRIA